MKRIDNFVKSIFFSKNYLGIDKCYIFLYLLGIGIFGDLFDLYFYWLCRNIVIVLGKIVEWGRDR